LPRKIEVKLVLLDFYRTIPAEKLDEVLGNIDKQVEKQFYEEQVPVLQKQFDVEFLKDLDRKLRSFGSSMQMQKAAFREQMIARTMISQNVSRNREITHRELLDYYYAHVEDYKVAARARWEKLTVLFEKYPDKAAADRAICDMGNQVVGGAKFAAVAKKFSQGTNAWEGGQHDWTRKGSLVSEVLDKAIFSLPVFRLSPILTDDRGFHIIRVLEREDARQISFEEAQDGIRKKLQEQHREREVQDYLNELREKTYVWTIFDDAENAAVQARTAGESRPENHRRLYEPRYR
jgi:parvulin-like peptidyl-prolyl isomerase